MIKTYAVLDSCSQGTFITDEKIEDLGILDRQLKLNLKTLIGKKSEDTEAVDGLITSTVDYIKGRPMEWIELPKTLKELFASRKRRNSNT